MLPGPSRSRTSNCSRSRPGASWIGRRAASGGEICSPVALRPAGPASGSVDMETGELGQDGGRQVPGQGQHRAVPDGTGFDAVLTESAAERADEHDVLTGQTVEESVQPWSEAFQIFDSLGQHSGVYEDGMLQDVPKPVDESTPRAGSVGVDATTAAAPSACVVDLETGAWAADAGTSLRDGDQRMDAASANASGGTLTLVCRLSKPDSIDTGTPRSPRHLRCVAVDAIPPVFSCSRWCCRRTGRRGRSRPVASARRTACSTGRRSSWRPGGPPGSGAGGRRRSP